MIGVIGCRLEKPGVEELPKPPTPPALQWTAFIINGCAMESHRLTQWFCGIREKRPHVPIGVIVPDEPDYLRHLLSAQINFNVVIGPDALRETVRLSGVLNTLRQQSVEAAIVRRWITTYGPLAGSNSELLDLLAACASRGGSVTRAAASAGTSLSTLHRKLRHAGYPSPGVLLRDGRVASVTLRMTNGVSKLNALAAAGWLSGSAYEKARARSKRGLSSTLRSGAREENRPGGDRNWGWTAYELRAILP